MIAWRSGGVHAARHIATKLYEENQSDKLAFLKALYGKSNRLSAEAQQVGDPEEAIKWDAFSNGVRAALCLIPNLGTAREAYDNMINNDYKIEITEEDIVRT